MKIKSYYSDTVEAAVRLASVELGEDAVFLGSKKSPTGDGEGSYEVSFAVLDQQRGDPNAPAPSGVPGDEAAQSNGASPTGSASGLWKQDASEQVEESRAGHQDAGDASASANGRPHWREFVGSDLDAGDTGPPTPAGDRGEVPVGLNQDRESNLHAQSQDVPPRHLREVAPAGAGDSIAEPLATGNAERRPAPPQSALGAAGEPFAAAARASLFGGDSRANPWNGESGWTLPSRAPGAGPASATAILDSVERLSSDIAMLRQGIENARPVDQTLLLPMGEVLTHTILAEVYCYLLGNEVDLGLAAQLVSGLKADVEQGAGRARVRELLGLRLQALCRTASAVGEAGVEFRTAAFVGPTGAGKTTALAKLAIRLTVADRRRVHLLTLDPLRVGAVEQLQAYAGLAEIPMTAVSDLSSLPRLLAQLSQGARRAELVLIDTPGYGPAEREQAQRLAECLSHVRGIDVHLVASLTVRPPDLRRSIERYRIFKPAKLLFTKLDETESYGGVLNAAVGTQLPLSYFSTGPRVPDDLVPASEPYLIDLMLNKTLPR